MTVYYLRADNGAIKIGYSKTPKSRFSELSTASPLDLELVAYEDGGLDVEKKRHQQYRLHNIRGEWFKPCPALNNRIAKLNPDYVPMPYIDRNEYERVNKKLDNIGSWVSINGNDPPKIIYVLTVSCFVIAGGISLLVEYGGELTTEELSLIMFFVSPAFFFVIAGYILVNVWQVKYFWGKVRGKK